MMVAIEVFVMQLMVITMVVIEMVLKLMVVITLFANNDGHGYDGSCICSSIHRNSDIIAVLVEVVAAIVW